LFSDEEEEESELDDELELDSEFDSEFDSDPLFDPELVSEGESPFEGVSCVGLSPVPEISVSLSVIGRWVS
jgi:hypothetical protein